MTTEELIAKTLIAGGIVAGAFGVGAGLVWLNWDYVCGKVPFSYRTSIKDIRTYIKEGS